MDIERLSKVQIVLLTLLVSFVTSIATGIVTVSLMDQAPPSVAQTVNRVIERTVQTVVPAGQSASANIVQQKTVVVKESELISSAVDKITPSVVRVFSSEQDTSAFLGLGVVVNASGTIATDNDALGESASIVVEFSGGTRTRALVVSRDTDTGIAYLSAATSTGSTTPAWVPATLSGEHPTLGETVVALSGKAIARIADGIVTALIPAKDPAPQIIDTGIDSSSIMPGSPLIDSTGNLIGVNTGVARASSVSGFIPASVIASPRGTASSGANAK